jgi:retinol dehydrogenase 14
MTMHAKVALVTGATGGIGRAIAMGLAKAGMHVILVGRDRARGERVRAEIGDQAELILADLSSLAEVRRLAEEVRRRHDHLSVLVNNAGINLNRMQKTVDGFERVFAVNHLAPFLLTNLLLDRLRVGAPARVVNLTSSGHASQLDFDDLQSEKGFSMMRSYMRSKLGNLLFTYELARRLAGTGVTVNAVHPGVVRTDLGRDFKGFFRVFLWVMWPFIRTPEKGADTAVWAATAPELEQVTGRYFANRREAKSKPISYDESVARKLWEVSERLTEIRTGAKLAATNR